MNSLTKSFYAGRIWGVDVFIHISVFIVVGILSLLSISGGIVAVISSFLFLSLVIGCILLHEYGHALTAKHYQIPVHSITLTPLGGLAKMAVTSHPDIEMRIILAGPLVNFIIAFLLLPIAVVSAYLWESNFFMYLLAINVLLTIFNLLPAFPLDGGRALRAYLKKKMSSLSATEKTVQVGNITCIILGIIGLIIDPILMMAAVMFYFAGQAELKMAYSHSNVHFNGNYQDPQQFVRNMRNFFYK